LGKRAFTASQSGLRRGVTLLACVLLVGCSLEPAQPDSSATDSLPAVESPRAANVLRRAPGDVERIAELEAQLAILQRQLADKQKQLVERQKQSNEEKQRLETLLKENQQRANELQGKLDAILAVDRDLRRGARNAD
jgi:TolA-binding protein